MKKYLSRIAFLFLLSFVTLAVIFLLSKSVFFASLAQSFDDSFTYKVHYSHNNHDGDIVIIKVDDYTLNALKDNTLGELSLEKADYAKLLENIFSLYQAKIAGVDIVFANRSLAGESDEKALADTLSKYKDRLIIATRSDAARTPLCQYAQVRHAAVNMQVSDEVIRNFSVQSFPYNISEFCAGYEVHPENTPEISLFANELARLLVLQSDATQKGELSSTLSGFEGRAQESLAIDFYHDGKTHTGTLGYESYSFLDIYEGKNVSHDGRKIDLKDKIILIGEVGTLIHDSHHTPVLKNTKMPGVEIQANILSTLLQGRVIQDIPFVWGILFLFFTAVGASVFFLRSFLALLLFCFSQIGIIILGYGLFVFGFFFPIFFTMMGSILSVLAAYIYKFQVSDKAKRNLKKQFSLYVSPDIVEQMSKNSEVISLQGEKRELSIFFSDIVGFTDISEQTAPEKMVQLLNEYFSEMTKIIHKHKGTLDKYIGDSVMCFFNAPLRQENHSYALCMTALEQQKRLRELNKIWIPQGYHEIKIRIGLHTGEAVHGNLGGTDTRVSYTIIGDSVNLASRLEGICKEYGIYICASQSVYALQKEAFHFRELDTISVKGKKQAVTIYELIGPKSVTIPENMLQAHQVYSQALELYRAGEYLKAGMMWQKNIHDSPSQHMARRCKDILDGKASTVQGVFVMTHK